MKAGWEARPLKELTTKIGSGATPRGGKNAYKAEGLSLIRSLNVHDLEFRMKDLAKIDDKQADALSNVAIEPHDVLLNITGASIARCAQVPEDVLPARVNQHVAILRPKLNLVDSRFLTYLLVSTEMKDRLLGIGDKAGATRQALTKSQLQSFRIPLPPLEEQQRIVEVLDEAFEGLARARANAEANLQNAHDLLAVSLDDIFSSDNPAWKTAGLSELCVIGDGNHSSKYPKKSEMVPEGVPFLRSGNIQNGEIDRGEMLYISESKHAELKKGHLRSGDVLFTNRGEIGKVAIVPDDLEGSNLNSQVAWLRCQGDLDNRFLYFFLQSGRMKQHYLDTQSGAALQQFTIKMLKAVTVRFPSLPEQEAAVKRMATIKDDIFRLVSAYQATTTDLDDLRQSLLQKAFAGELT